MQSKARLFLSVVLGTVALAVLVVFGLAFLAYITPKNNQISKCVVNLQYIDECKKKWDDDGKTNITPTWDDLRPFFPPMWSNRIPTCPSGGTYTIGRVGEPPKCSIGGPGHAVDKY
jgi:hypothetical protein